MKLRNRLALGAMEMYVRLFINQQERKSLSKRY